MAVTFAVGQTYAVKLRGGSFGLCRVAWTRHAWTHTAVVGLEGFSDAMPTLAQAAVAPLLVMQHPYYEGPFWARVLRKLAPPPGFTLLGHTDPRDGEGELRLGDDWHDPDHVHRSTVWKAVEQTLGRELRYRRDAGGYRAKIAQEPRPGDVYAWPEEDAVCRVLSVLGRTDEDRLAFSRNLAWYQGLGPLPPDRLPEALAGAPFDLLSTTGLPSESWTRVGNVPVSDAERAVRPDALGGWRG